MKISSIIFFIILLMFTSCTDSEKEKKLQERENSLMLKEKEFAAKEDEYRNLIAMRDSITQQADSVVVNNLPANILGKWNGKMVCTESSCAEHAIGDQRTDVWEFSENGKTVLAKVTDRSGNLKVYSGSYSNSELNLQSKEDSTSTRKTEINLIWNNLQANSLKGARKVIANNNCVAKFTLELEKSKSKL